MINSITTPWLSKSSYKRFLCRTVLIIQLRWHNHSAFVCSFLLVGFMRKPVNNRVNCTNFRHTTKRINLHNISADACSRSVDRWIHANPIDLIRRRFNGISLVLLSQKKIRCKWQVRHLKFSWKLSTIVSQRFDWWLGRLTGWLVGCMANWLG